MYENTHTNLLTFQDHAVAAPDTVMRSLWIFAIFVLFTIPHPHNAIAEIPQISLEITGIGSPPKIASVKELSVFGGKTVNLYVDVFGSTDKRIEIAVDLFQAGSGKIAVPVRSNNPMPLGPDLSRNPRRQISLPLELPEVDQVCIFYARCRLRFAGEDKWQNAGSTEIRVYPLDVLKPMRLFAEKNPVILLGENTGFRKFFKEAGIAFELRADSFLEDSKEPSLAFVDYMDKEGYKLPQYLPSNLAIIVFCQTAGRFPRTVIRPAGKGILIEIKTDWPDDLTKDPAAQEFLLELFSLALEQLQTNPN
jgi:hypothetical protein